MTKKRTIALFIVTTLLFLILAPPAFAESERRKKMNDAFGNSFGDEMTILLVAGGIYLLVTMLQDSDNFAYSPGDAGDVLFNFQDYPTASIGGNNLSLYPGAGDAINYDIDWLLTDRREGRIWATTGVTMEFPVTSSGLSFESAEMEGNFKMGYRDDAWDYNLYFSPVTDDGARAMAWLIYNY